MLSVGLMSGTSMDGIDAALLETDGTPTGLCELGYTSLVYDPRFRKLLKAAEYAIRNCSGDMQKANHYFPQAIHDYLVNELKIIDPQAEMVVLQGYLPDQITLANVIQHSTELHVEVVRTLLKKLNYSVEQIDVVGYHGQTMFHQPTRKISIVLGDGKYLAEQLGITVVNDFRSADVAAGGQGAPFAPLYHLALAIRDHKIPAVVVNCGGIANVTLIKNSTENDLLSLDTGPGNGLIDRLVTQRTQGKENMDVDGFYGLNGLVHENVLQKLYEKTIAKEGKNYFSIPAPKALDIGDMNLIAELDALSLEDACATLEAFTADSIIKSLELLKTELPKYWILAGGGWKNPVIKRELIMRLKQKLGDEVQVQTADEAGWNAQAMEAQIFAYLAVRSLQKKPLSVPGTTRVPEPFTGGKIHLPRKGATQAVIKLIQANHSAMMHA